MVATFGQTNQAKYIAMAQDGLMATGSDLDCYLNLQAKGTGYIYFWTNNSNTISINSDGTTIQNALELMQQVQTQDK